MATLLHYPLCVFSRSIRLALTPTGLAVLQGAEQEMADVLGRIFEHAADADTLLGALVDLDNALALRMQARLREVKS